MGQGIGQCLSNLRQRLIDFSLQLQEPGYAAHRRTAVALDVMANLWPPTARKTRTVQAS
jgi:hypothetical protein